MFVHYGDFLKILTLSSLNRKRSLPFLYDTLNLPPRFTDPHLDPLELLPVIIFFTFHRLQLLS